MTVRVVRDDDEMLHLPSYEAGYRDGIDAGRRHVEEEWRGAMSAAARVARDVASAGSYADRAEARGEPEHAAAHRAEMVRRGVSS